ncbi:MAG: C25 family cysteine peptidase, partial [Candidatus Thermoplasmatota archaeon]
MVRIFGIILLLLLSPLLVPSAQESEYKAKTAVLFNENIKYAIIAPQSFKDALAPLADWKTKKGLMADFFALEWIYSNFEGRDSQEKIHEFLRSLYTNSSLKWVLLVGDAD